MTATEAWTERELLDRLHRRLSVRSQGASRRYVVAEHVRNGAAHQADRTLDAVAVDTWPSGGLALHGYEVKTSRADYLRELAEPEKSVCWGEHLDYLWFVTAPDVVRGDLPDGWGHLVARGAGLTVSRQAWQLHPLNRGYGDLAHRPLPRPIVVALLRALVRPS